MCHYTVPSTQGPHADIHYEKGLICTDCHSAEEMHGDGNIYAYQMQAVTTACEDCHPDTRKADGIVTDEFYLAVAIDGMIKPFLEMSTSYGNETHTGYGEWMPHTITIHSTGYDRLDNRCTHLYILFLCVAYATYLSYGVVI